jgi:hypothetical protein
LRARNYLRAGWIDAENPLYVSSVLRTHRTAPQRGRLSGVCAGEPTTCGNRQCGQEEDLFENLKRRL